MKDTSPHIQISDSSSNLSGQATSRIDGAGDSSSPLRVAVLIPALNASATIVDLVLGIRKYVPRGDIIVVDDGSCDYTGQLAQKAGAIVLHHRKNRGKGAALRTGFQHIIGECFNGVIVLDADGQHDRRFIPAFLKRARRGDSDILIGSRMGRIGQMPWVRVVTNRITSAFISALARQKIPDSQSGYRYIRVDVLRELRLKTSHYDTESELLIQAGRMGHQIDSIPISSIYRGEKSAIRAGRDTLRFIFLVVRSFFSL